MPCHTSTFCLNPVEVYPSLISSLSFHPFYCLGHMMSEMPLEPQLAKMLLISPEFNCSNEVQYLKQYVKHPSLYCRLKHSLLHITYWALSTLIIFICASNSIHSSMLMFLSTYMLMIICPSWHLTAWDTFPTPTTINSPINTLPFSRQCMRVLDALHSGDAFLSFHLHEATRSSESGEYWVLGIDAPCCAMPWDDHSTAMQVALQYNAHHCHR